MGKSANPLISVQYTDETNYVEASSTDDVMGMVMDANWGPCGTPVVCNSTTFRSIFNPQGLGRLNGTLATALRAFEKNQSYIEIVRLGSKENWLFVYITSAGTVGTYSYPYSTDSSAIDFSAVATAIETSFEGDPKPTVQALFRLRYPGGFPAQITLSASPKTFLGTQMYSLELAAYSGQTYTTAGASARGKSTKASGATAQPSFTNILETLTFSLVDLTYNGVSYNYADVITNDSTYFVSDVAWAAGKSVSVALTNAPFVYKLQMRRFRALLLLLLQFRLTWQMTSSQPTSFSRIVTFRRLRSWLIVTFGMLIWKAIAILFLISLRVRVQS